MSSIGHPNVRQRHLLELLALGFAILVGIGFFYAPRFEDFLGYSVVLFAALMPAALWLRAGANGIPILPTCALLYLVYFAIPTLRGAGETSGYSPEHVLDADLLIAVFLIVATATSARFLRPTQSATTRWAPRQAINKRALVVLVMIGLGMGLGFYAIQYSSFANLLGSAFGVFRAVFLAPTLLACYLLGYGKAKRMFSGFQLIIALVALAAIMVFQMGGLQLIGVATEMGAALLGYVYTAKRIPWVAVLLVAALVSVFQAGKAEIRDRYADIDITAQLTPSLVANWFEVGLDKISQPKHQSVADRASLLPQMIRVQQWTPNRVPYLEGETYTYLPSIIVPRIFNPSRVRTQVVMNLLDIRYGFLTREGTEATAVGVNIVPEAFANFGYLGVFVIAVLFGMFTGYFTRISMNQDATSLPMLLAIAAMVTVTDLEADVSYLLTTFFQSAVAVVVFYYALHHLFGVRQPMLRPKEIA